MTKETIGRALWQFRMERNLTLVQVATMIGIGKSALAMIEKGQRRPNDRTFYRIRKAFPTLFEAA